MFLGKKKNLFILVLLLATFFTFAPDITFAQTDANLDATETDTGAAYVTQPFDPLGSVVYRALTAIGGLVAWLGGTLLNISLSMFVFNLPETVRVFALMDIIDYVWSFVRDIFNLLFIFGLTWIGFRFILGINVSDAKRNLGTILIAALLINFSLYATQLIIDVGNVAAAEIGDLFTPAEGSPTQNVLGIEIIDVASSFIASTDIANIGSHTLALSSYSSTGEEIDVGSGRALGLADALGMGLTIAVLLILIGFVFAAGAFLMFARFFYLLFLMMFSPIMFLGFVLPQMQNVTKDWWTKLINQTIVGPAYLFMLLIALRALDTLMQSRGDDLMNTWGFIISSLLVAAFVWASLIVAKKFGGAGAATAMNMGQGMGRSIRGYAGRAAGGATFGVAAGILRGQIGARAQRYADDDNAKRRAANSFIGRQVWNASKKIGDASFDARQVGGVGKKLGIGEGVKGGYKTVTDNVAKKDKAFNDSLGKVSDEDPKVASLLLDIEASTVAIDKQKEFVQNLRKSGAPQTEVDAAKANLEDLEYKQTKQKESLEAERYRNQLGEVIPKSRGKLDEIKSYKDKLNEHLNAYADPTANDDTKKTLAKSIADLKKRIAEEEKTNGGYIAYTEREGNLSSVQGAVRLVRNILTERDNKMTKNSAEEMRKDYKAKVKSKDKGKDKSKDSGDKKDKPEDKAA